MSTNDNIKRIKPTELEKTVSGYRYDSALFHGIEQDIWSQMHHYNGDFGHKMVEHLTRTTTDFANFLRSEGYDEEKVLNLASAFRLHDAGKILQSPTLWGLEEKPSESVRAQRKEHVNLGMNVLERALERHEAVNGHPHLSVIECFMRYHHERINGKGPQGLSGDGLGTVLEIAGIIDGLDGKIQTRQAGNLMRPSQARRELEERKAKALRDMTGQPTYTRETKHAGEYAPALLARVIDFYQKDMDVWVLPKPAQGSKAFQSHQGLAL